MSMIQVVSPIFGLLLALVLMIVKYRRRESSTSSSGGHADEAFKKKAKLPAGPWKLPIIGNLHQMMVAGGSVPHRIIAELANKYGPIMHLQIGEMSAVILSSPEAAEAAFTTHDLALAQRPQNVFLDNITYKSSGVALCPYGHRWRLLRKLCASHLLNLNRVNSFKSIREEEVYNFVQSITLSSHGVVNLSQMVLVLTNAMISRAAVGKKIDNELISLLNRLMEMGGAILMYQVFPSYKFLHRLTGLTAASEDIHSRIDNILDNILDDHRETAAAAAAPREQGEQNLVEMLLTLQASADPDFPVTTDTIKAVVLDMVVAGIENPCTIIEWAMAEMLRNPRVMKMAQAEVRNRKGKIMEEADLEELRYLKCVVKETLRLHPPIPLIPRESRESCEIGGYEIPVNTTVLINTWSINRDPRYWVDPHCFHPERFLHDSFSNSNRYEYVPFGAGKRMCPGIYFGILSVELPLAHLLYHFDWKLPHGMKPQDVDMTESSLVTAKKKNDLFVIPSPYLP